MVKYLSKTSKLLFILLVLFVFIDRSIGYWNTVQYAEHLYLKDSLFQSVETYINIFNKYGIKWIKEINNAFYVSSLCNNKFNDTLEKILIKDGLLFPLLYYERLENFKDYKYSRKEIRKGKSITKSKKLILKQWKKIEKRDQLVRLPIIFPLISRKRFIEASEKNIQKLIYLYVKNNHSFPTLLDLGLYHDKFCSLDIPYYIVLHHIFDSIYEDSTTLFKKYSLDSIMHLELKKGNISPTMVAYLKLLELDYDSSINPMKKISYDSLFVLWYELPKMEYSEIHNYLSELELEQINKLRESVDLEPISKEYVRKRKIFYKRGLQIW